MTAHIHDPLVLPFLVGHGCAVRLFSLRSIWLAGKLHSRIGSWCYICQPRRTAEPDHFSSAKVSANQALRRTEARRPPRRCARPMSRMHRNAPNGSVSVHSHWPARCVSGLWLLSLVPLLLSPPCASPGWSVPSGELTCVIPRRPLTAAIT